MRNRNRTFLLGAGFSKAVADGPLMIEIWSWIENAYKQEKNRQISGGNNRLKWFAHLKDFKAQIERQATQGFPKDEIESVEKIDIEYLFTLIDLKLMGPHVHFKKETKSKTYDPATSDFQLRETKDYLLTYLYLIFERLKGNHLGDKFARITKENDEIITFNYDLVLEKALWRADIWSPLAGYVGVHKFKIDEDKKRLEEAKRYSKLKIHKMHGSINWDSGIVIETDNIESGGFHFDEIEKILNRSPILNRPYAGKHNPPWILPSFVKPFEEKEFYDIWQSAINVMSKTDELVIIGYSFRPEDSSSFFLLSMLSQKCNIMIVDPCAEKVKERLGNKGLKAPEIFKSLENYL